jgi:hypothetical protein
VIRWKKAFVFAAVALAAMLSVTACSQHVDESDQGAAQTAAVQPASTVSALTAHSTPVGAATTATAAVANAAYWYASQAPAASTSAGSQAKLTVSVAPVSVSNVTTDAYSGGGEINDGHRRIIDLKDWASAEKPDVATLVSFGMIPMSPRQDISGPGKPYRPFVGLASGWLLLTEDGNGDLFVLLPLPHSLLTFSTEDECQFAAQDLTQWAGSYHDHRCIPGGRKPDAE